MAYLRYLDDDGHLQTANLGTEPVIIGRANTCQLIITSDMISREHARIDPADGGRYQIRDLGARNKTYVSGQLVSETHLSPGDVIRIGDRTVEYLDDYPIKANLEFESLLSPDRADPPDSEWIKVKSPISLSAGQLEALAALFSGVTLTARPEDIADAALGQIMVHLGAERGFVAWRGEGKRDLAPIAHRAMGVGATGQRMPVSQSFVYSAFLQHVAGRYPAAASKVDMKLGYASVAAIAPLTYRGETKGVIYIDRPNSKKVFSAAAQAALAAAGAQLGSLIMDTSRRIAASASREGAAWMSTIRRVQTSLSNPPQGSDTFGVSATTVPGRVRCGDFFDVIHLDEQRIGIVVVDAGGHGLTGLAQAVGIRSAIRSGLAISEDLLLDPATIFAAMNKMMASQESRHVISCLFIGLDLAAGRLAYINAGAMPPLLIKAPGRLVTLDQSALVLGIDPDYTYEATRTDLPEVFRLVCYTDGLTEASGGAGEPLGYGRLRDTLLDQSTLGDVQQVQDCIKAAWSTHLAGTEADDDASVLVIARGERKPAEQK